jgi:hypothetical protein
VTREAAGCPRHSKGRAGSRVLMVQGPHLAGRSSSAASEYRSGRFEAFTAVTMKNNVFWDVTPCGSCKNRRFGGT